jgi:antitoxin FitA
LATEYPSFPVLMLDFTQKYSESVAVASITIELSDNQLQTLQDLAKTYGIPLEVLLRASLEDWLNSQKSDFADASYYVLTKNAELYRRLA